MWLVVLVEEMRTCIRHCGFDELLTQRRVPAFEFSLDLFTRRLVGRDTELKVLGLRFGYGVEALLQAPLGVVEPLVDISRFSGQDEPPVSESSCASSSGSFCSTAL